MKTRILAAIALVVALPAAAQANSLMNERAFDQQSETLNVQRTAEYQALPTPYSVDTVSGGHSAAADQALQNVAQSTQLATSIQAGNNDLIGQGHSVAAAQALQNAEGAGSNAQGNVEVSFANL